MHANALILITTFSTGIILYLHTLSVYIHEDILPPSTGLFVPAL